MNDKPKCPVFGCTIPRGIPHEHPAGVSAVMRDPVAPLNADERAELERYRAAAETDIGEDAKRLRDALISQARGMQCVAPGSPLYDRAMGTNYYVVPADAPMVPGRKLRDALVLAGHKPGDTLTFEEVKPAPRRSFVSLTARVAFWIVLAVTVAIWIFAGVKP